MKRTFSFVLWGAVGFSAAVGASSVTKITFDEFAAGGNPNGEQSLGTTFSASGADFVSQGDGDTAVGIGGTIDYFETAQASNIYDHVSLSNFSIAAADFENFNFLGVELAGSGEVLVEGLIGDQVVTSNTLSLSELSGERVTPSELGINGNGLSRLSFSTGGGVASPPLATASSEESEKNATLPLVLSDYVEIDNIEFEIEEQVAPSPVPLPASGLLLGAAALGAGLYSRRKKLS